VPIDLQLTHRPSGVNHKSGFDFPYEKLNEKGVYYTQAEIRDAIDNVQVGQYGYIQIPLGQLHELMAYLNVLTPEELTIFYEKFPGINILGHGVAGENHYYIVTFLEKSRFSVITFENCDLRLKDYRKNKYCKAIILRGLRNRKVRTVPWAQRDEMYVNSAFFSQFNPDVLNAILVDGEVFFQCNNQRNSEVIKMIPAEKNMRIMFRNGLATSRNTIKMFHSNDPKSVLITSSGYRIDP
jgi:hypothetical protein